jgi:hypothetical protein
MSENRLAQLLRQCQHHDIDVKVDALSRLKNELEGGTEIQDVESFIPVLRMCLRTSNQLLSSAALFTLVHFCSIVLSTRVPTSHAFDAPAAESTMLRAPHTAPPDINLLRTILNAYLPAGGIFDRLGDREKPQTKARELLVLLGGVSFLAGNSGQVPFKSRDKSMETPLSIYERSMKELGLGSRAWKIREQALLILVQVRRIQPLFPLRPYLSQLVDCLEDTDSHVRETARRSVVELFTGPAASETARTELKKELIKKNVRKAIVDDVLSKLLMSSTNHNSSNVIPGSLEQDGPSSKDYVPPSGALLSERPSGPSTSTPYNRSDSLGMGSARVVSCDDSSTPIHFTEDLETTPVYVASPRDLESEFLALQRPFEGKESEHNWAGREHGVKRIQGMLKGDITSRYSECFRCLIKEFLPLSVKTLNSLRTTLCVSTCNLYAGLAVHLGTDLDQHCEFLISQLLRLASFTKKIAAQRSQAAIATILEHTSAQPRVILPLLLGAAKEKSSQCRTYAIDHVRHYLLIHGSKSKSAIENSGSVDILDRIIRMTLSDATPSVKETARKCFWVFQPIWPACSYSISASLDALAKKQLERACPDTVNFVPTIAPVAPPSKKLSVAAALAASRAKARKAVTLPSTHSNPDSTSPFPLIQHTVGSSSPITTLQSPPTSPSYQLPPSGPDADMYKSTTNSVSHLPTLNQTSSPIILPPLSTGHQSMPSTSSLLLTRAHLENPPDCTIFSEQKNGREFLASRSSGSSPFSKFNEQEVGFEATDDQPVFLPWPVGEPILDEPDPTYYSSHIAATPLDTASLSAQYCLSLESDSPDAVSVEPPDPGEMVSLRLRAEQAKSADLNLSELADSHEAQSVLKPVVLPSSAFTLDEDYTPLQVTQDPHPPHIHPSGKFSVASSSLVLQRAASLHDSPQRDRNFIDPIDNKAIDISEAQGNRSNRWPDHLTSSEYQDFMTCINALESDSVTATSMTKLLRIISEGMTNEHASLVTSRQNTRLSQLPEHVALFPSTDPISDNDRMCVFSRLIDALLAYLGPSKVSFSPLFSKRLNYNHRFVSHLNTSSMALLCCGK